MLKMSVLDYRITSDARQVIVSKVRRDEKSEIVMTEQKDGTLTESASVIGYYSNLSKALVAIQRDYVLSQGTEIETIKDYRNELDSIHKKMETELNLGEGFD